MGAGSLNELGLYKRSPQKSVYEICSCKEDCVARTFAKFGLRLDVEISHARVGKERSHPYIAVSSWVQILDKVGRLHELAGGCKDFSTTLRDYWAKFEKAHPNHQVFAEARKGNISLDTSIPVLLHGDEGTTYKKDGALVLTFQSALGRGTSASSRKLGNLLSDEHARLNFLGHAFETRFLIISALKAWFSNKRFSEFCVLSKSLYMFGFQTF